MNAYCDRQSVEINSIAFLFDGRRLRAEQTPDEVSLSLSLSLSPQCIFAKQFMGNWCQRKITFVFFFFLFSARNGGR